MSPISSLTHGYWEKPVLLVSGPALVGHRCCSVTVNVLSLCLFVCLFVFCFLWWGGGGAGGGRS